MIVACFSAGVSSAVATKLAIEKVDHIIYQHIDDQHPDTMRFVRDCEGWFGKPITIQQSKYKSVENVCLAMRYVNGPDGAPCTKLLKRRERQQWEQATAFFEHIDLVWGLDAEEKKRADNMVERVTGYKHVFPLIDNGITKETAHGMLREAGINRPAMYDLGYSNNNCIGCVKGGMGYWNKIRVDFPDVFKGRAEMERIIGGTCIKGVYLDELDPDRGRKTVAIPACFGTCEGANDTT